MPPRTRPGSPASDAPVKDGWLIDLLGNRFQLLAIDCEAPQGFDVDGVAIETLTLKTQDCPSEALRERYLGKAESAVYLMRPDQHVAARWPSFDADRVAAALRRAIGRGREDA